jgi:hypothetical protein
VICSRSAVGLILLIGETCLSCSMLINGTDSANGVHCSSVFIDGQCGDKIETHQVIARR